MIKIPDKQKLAELKRQFLERLEIWRLRAATHPKVVVWRLRLFGVHPALGNHFWKFASAIALCLLLLAAMNLFFWRAPRPFPEQALVSVERGAALSQIAESFESQGIIRSNIWLKVFITLWGGQKKVIAGDYYFPEPVSVLKVARMLRHGEFGLINQKVTIPEGLSSFEIAKILKEEIPNFDDQGFVKEVSDNGYEGYLFPDTYFFMPNIKASDVIHMMRENFTRQVKAYEEDIAKLDKPLSDIVIMASIIEDEANSSLESKRIVSGILWKRLGLEMPLQVDAPFQYYNGKNSYTLTKDDLAEEHPYNTYRNKGLTPTAIANPGIDSLRAAIAPTNTEYLYFLSDKKGNMYYAENFEGHKRNRELYLN